MKRLAPVPLLLLAACIAPENEQFEKLRPGRWIEAKGHTVDGVVRYDEVDELPRSDSDKAEKVEITAAVVEATPSQLKILNLDLKADAETEYENEKKEKIDPFVSATGDWVRVKLRNKDDELKLRTVREQEKRDQFKVEGEVLAFDADKLMLDVGGVRLPIVPDASVTMIGDRDANDPLSLFKADDQKGVPFTIPLGDNVLLGGGVSASADNQGDYDLDKTTQRDRSSTDFSAKLDVLWLFGTSGSYALAEVQANRTDAYRRNAVDTHNSVEQITRAFASLHVAEGLQILVGRQDLDEEREFVYDEVLDGIRALYVDGPWEFEGSASVGRDFAAPRNSVQDTAFFTSMARYHLDKDWVLGAYAVKRTDDSAFDHEPLLVGVRSIDSPRYGLGHWAELSLARGHTQWANNPGGPIDNAVADNREDIRGTAFDVGAIYTFEHLLRPALAVGYAFGTGARDSARDVGYRQTGYNDNNGKLGGVTSVRYYGELLRPELANLAVFTFAAAFRPMPRTSLSFLYHTYTQDYAAQYGPFTDLRLSTNSVPNGLSPDMGQEYDIVLGYRAAAGLTMEIVAARFEPGPAYNNQDAASKLDFTARWSF